LVDKYILIPLYREEYKVVGNVACRRELKDAHILVRKADGKSRLARHAQKDEYY
jgi:hypothetical protein